MGAVVGGLGACVASCAGGMLASCCCAAAGAGRTNSTLATRMLLVYLQVFTTFLALVLSAHPWTWIGAWFCWIPGFDNIGPCACDRDPLFHGDVHNEQCWMEQMIFRAEFSGFCVFLFVLLLCVSGCSDTAAHGYPVAKFLMVPLLVIAYLFVPNSFFNFYGNAANILSSIYVIGQALLLVDVGYTINERIMSKHTESHRRNLHESPTWKIVILVISALLFLGSIIGSVFLFVGFNQSVWIVIVALVLSIVFGVLSVTCAWCPHGNILTSCIVMAYSIWLSYEALLSINDGSSVPTFIKWVGLSIAAFSLFGTAFGSGLGLNGGETEAMAAQANVEAATAEDGAASGGASGEGAGEGGPFNKTDFILQSVVHAACALYITTELAPTQSWLAFTFNSINVIAALLLFGFTLFAPKIFPDRSF